MSEEEKKLSSSQQCQDDIIDAEIVPQQRSENFIARLFDGRRNRKKFLLHLFLSGIAISLSGILLTLNFWVSVFFAGLSSVYYYSNISKRLHDFNAPAGWCVPLAVVSYITLSPGSWGTLAVIIHVISIISFSVIRGTKGPNDYGEA